MCDAPHSRAAVKERAEHERLLQTMCEAPSDNVRSRLPLELSLRGPASGGPGMSNSVWCTAAATEGCLTSAASLGKVSTSAFEAACRHTIPLSPALWQQPSTQSQAPSQASLPSASLAVPHCHVALVLLSTVCVADPAVWTWLCSPALLPDHLQRSPGQGARCAVRPAPSSSAAPASMCKVLRC